MPRQCVRQLVCALAVLALAVAACGGGGGQAAPTATCTTMVPGTGGSPSPTTTPCVIGATEQPTTSPDVEPGGEEWNGSADITSSAVYPDGTTCRDDGWELEFTFGVSAEGTIDGQGSGELASAPTCPFPIGPWWNHVEYQVLGEESAGGFSIRFALVSWEPADGAEHAGFVSMFGLPALPSGGPPVAVAVTGTSGTGQGSWQFESGNPTAVYSANGTVSIECATCD